MALITVTGYFANPNGASVEYQDILQPADAAGGIKVFSDGVEVTNSLTLGGGIYYVPAGSEYTSFVGGFQLLDFPSGTTLTFKYGEQNLVGKDAFGGNEIQFQIPDIDAQFALPDFQIYFDFEEVFGCTDEHATNYNSSATDDDGSCEYYDYTDKLKITEIHYYPNGNAQVGAGNLSHTDTWEFFEITNVSDGTIPMQGISLGFFTGGPEYDRSGDLWDDGLPIGSQLEPGGKIVFTVRSDTYNRTCWCISDEAPYVWTQNTVCNSSACPEGHEYRTFEHLIAYDGTNPETANLYEWQNGNWNLDNNAETITIRDAVPTVIQGEVVDGDGDAHDNNNNPGRLIDKVSYNSITGTINPGNQPFSSCPDDWPSSVYSLNKTIVLIHNSLDSDCGSNWYRSGLKGGSPGLPNSLSWNTDAFYEHIGGRVILSEFYYNPPGNQTQNEFIEIYNSSNYPISLAGWNASDIDLPGIPDFTIGPSEHFLLTRGNDGAHITPYECTGTFQESNMWTYNGFQSTSDYITLRDLHSTFIDAVDLGIFDTSYEEYDSWFSNYGGLHAYGSPNGGGSSVEFTWWEDTCFSSNATAINCWQASILEGGSPCAQALQPEQGCMDSSACNYSETANYELTNDCVYPLDCCLDNNSDGICDSAENGIVNDNNQTCGSCPNGYTQPTYDAQDNIIYNVFGCTNQEACNYNPAANYDDGTCVTGYFECPGFEGTVTGCDCNGVCMDVSIYNGGQNAELNDCNQCIFGDTGVVEDNNDFDNGPYGSDCNGDCIPIPPFNCDDLNTIGCAQVNECGVCVGGNTEYDILDSSNNTTFSNFPTRALSTRTIDGVAQTIYISELQDCAGLCPPDEGYDMDGAPGYYLGLDHCNICGGDNVNPLNPPSFEQGNCGTDNVDCPQVGCDNLCFSDAQNLGCGCGEDGPLTFYNDIDGDGIGNSLSTAEFCTEEIANTNGYVVTGGDSNDYCDNDATTGDYYTGNDFGLDDCNICHYESDNSVTTNFNYFGDDFNTSKDCGDGINENSGLCPQDEGFNNPPGTQRADTNGDGIANECFETLVWHTSDNTFEFGNIINHGCNFTNRCKGIDDVWGPGVVMRVDGIIIDISGESAKGCRDPQALNYERRHYFDCVGAQLGTNYGCCEYPEDCNNEEGGSAFVDDCGVCSEGNTGHIANSDMDCNGDCAEGTPEWDGGVGGTAFLDDCEVCSGGNSGHEANSDIDCNGDCFGTAVIPADDIGNCCDPITVQTWYQDLDNDQLGDPDVSVQICLEYIFDYMETTGQNWVLNNDDDLPDVYCPATCDVNGQNQGSGENQCIIDCAGVCGGTAAIDTCGVCSGGNTNHEADSDVDCSGTCFGEAYLDGCGNCVGEGTSTAEQGCFDFVDELGYDAAYELYLTGQGYFEGVCPPNWARDCSGTCEGNLSPDCAGVCGGNSQFDQCQGDVDDEDSCYDPIGDPPNICVGCTDPTACNYDSTATIDSGGCRWFNCNGECICETDSQYDPSCGTILDTCGQCGGDNDCEGCTDPLAVNFDPFATQNFNHNCVYGDIQIQPSSTNGLSNNLYNIKPVGNDNSGQNITFGDSDYNANFGGWKFQAEDEVVSVYRLRVDIKSKSFQTEPTSPYTVNTGVSSSISGDIHFDGYQGSGDCDWLIQHPTSNPDTGIGMDSFESFINCGYSKILETDAEYFFEIEVTGSKGNSVKLNKLIDVNGLFFVKQTLEWNGNSQPFLPQQGINIPYNSIISSNFSNTRQWYSQNNLMDREMLGCFFYDEDQPLSDSDWPQISNSYNYLSKQYDLVFSPTFLWGYCNTTGDPESPNYQTCIGGENHGVFCDTDDSTCRTEDWDTEGGSFTPDVVATTRKAQYRRYGTGSPYAGTDKAVTHRYYDKEILPEHYEDLSAPAEFNFLFSVRAELDTTDASKVFDQRNFKDLDSEKHDYFLGFIDWGDETTAEENQFDFRDSPQKLSEGTVLTHRYERPGVYEISGYMFAMYKNSACTTRCFVPEIDETEGDLPPWYDAHSGASYDSDGDGIPDTPYVATPNIFNVSEETCGEMGGIFTSNTDGYCGMIGTKKFTHRMIVNSNEVQEVFLPYDGSELVIGGTSDNSIYYNTIQRELGYLQSGQKIDLEFKYIQDKLETEYALSKMNEFSVENSATLNIFNQSILSGSVDNDGNITNGEIIVSGSYNDGYGEIAAGNYFGNADINQVRFFNRGDLTMDDMLGFKTVPIENSYKLIEGNSAVLITAPHSPVTLRPTSGYDSNGIYPAYPHEPDDYTGAMAYQVAKLTNSHMLISTYMQDDANYYHHLGYDFFGRIADTVTPAFSGMEGQLHPFKKKLKEYLIEHPEIKLVIDFHGAGDYRTFAVDIGVAYPEKNRDPNGDYVSGYVDTGWYPGNDEGLNLYSNSDFDWINDEDFPGPAHPSANKFWNGNLDSQWDVLSDIDTYAPSMVTDLGRGITSNQNPNGESLLEKLIQILEQNNIGSGDGYHDRYYYNLYSHDGNGGEYNGTGTEYQIPYYYFRGEFLEQESHSCPDGESNIFNLAKYLNECDTEIYDDCQDAWELYLDGTNYCAEPGVKKPVVIGRDFTAGRQHTVTRFVALDAKSGDLYENIEMDDPAPFIGNVDAFQFEMSRNHREFSPNDPQDLRMYKAMSEFITFVNNYYGIETPSIDFDSDEFKSLYNKTYEDYQWLEEQGEILLDDDAILEIHPNNPGSKRYWKNIIPEDYDITYREGYYDYGVEINNELYYNGETEITLKPNTTTLNLNQTFKICNKDEYITEQNSCEILFDDITFDKYYLTDKNDRLVGGLDSNTTLSNNIVYWNIDNMVIGSSDFNTLFDGNNNVEQITWIQNGQTTNSTRYTGEWIPVDDNTEPQLLILEKGRFYLFKMYTQVNLQRDELDSNLKLRKTYLNHRKIVDINSNQQWLPTIKSIIYSNDESDIGGPADEDNQPRSRDEEILKIKEIIPYYPVLPKLDTFGKFSTDDNLQKSPITLLENSIWGSDGNLVNTDPGQCVCGPDGFTIQNNCSPGYQPTCIFIESEVYDCECQFIQFTDNLEETGDSPGDESETISSNNLTEINIPFGTDNRLWYEYDTNSPAVNESYSDDITKNVIVDVNFSEIDVDDNRLPNNSGVEYYNYVFGDYKVEFDGETRTPSKGSFENLPQIRKDKGRAY